MFTLTIDTALRNLLPHFKVGIVHYHNVTVAPTPKMLQGRIELFWERLRLEYSLDTLNHIQQVQYYRSCFKDLHMDPARYRPSSEALLRRVLQNKGIPFIHTAADLNNFFSLKYFIPCGLYDADKLIGKNIVMRLGEGNENYISLTGRETSVDGKWITVDGVGPFGSPVVDSERTKVTEESKNLVHIIYMPSFIQNHEEGMDLLHSLHEMMNHVQGGELAQVEIFSS